MGFETSLENIPILPTYFKLTPMKHLFIVLLLLPFGLMAQELPVDTATKKISYAGVIEAPGTSKAALKDKFKEWAVLNLKSTKGVIELATDDKVIAKSYNTITAINKTAASTQNLWYNTIATFEDGKIRYDFTNLYLGPVNPDQPAEGLILGLEQKAKIKGAKMMLPYWVGWRTETIKTMENLQQSLRAYLQK